MKSLRKFSGVFFVSLFLLMEFGAALAGTVKFQKKTIQDHQGFGIEFCRFMAPANWQVEGGVTWKPNSFQLTESALKVFAPDEQAAYEIFPEQIYFYSQDPYMNSVYGRHARIHPPVDALSYLEGIFLPVRRAHAADLKIVKRNRLPELARETETNYQKQRKGNPYLAALTQGTASRFDAGSLTIEYMSGETTVAETIFAVCSYSGAGIFTNWGPIRQYSLRSSKKSRKKNTPILQVVSTSFQINPMWEYKISQVYYMMVQQQRQALSSIGELSGYISRTNDDISNMLMSSYREREKIFDKTNSQWSEYIRSVEPYRDPVNNTDVEVPNNFERAWTNGSDYLFSEDPNFNPNRSSGPSWTPLERVRR